MYVSYFCVVQMGHSHPNAEINSYYKDFPVFGNLTKLLLCWGNEGIYEWDEVVKILQKCPKLQAISISKVCLLHLWIVIGFC